MQSSLTHGDENIAETIPDAQVAAWQLLSDEGIPVVVMRDTPRFPFKVPECLQTESDPLQCSATQETLYPVVDIFAEADLPENVLTVDVTDSFCEDGLCPPVIGNIVVSRDASHMTATFAKTLTDPIRAQLKEALPQLFSD